MKHIIAAVFFFETCFLQNAIACMSFSRVKDEYPLPKEEVALIIWDQKNGVEHFIRQAKFEGVSQDFAFIVPVPATPELEEAPAELMAWVYTKLYSKESPNSGGAVAHLGRGSSQSAVEVVKTQDVAGMQAYVLRSSDPEALQKWLNENGYQTPKSSLAWIQHYVAQKWEFVAFKIKNTNPKQAQQRTASPFVRISFKTPRMIYPYRESEERKPVPGRDLSVFVIAPEPVVTSYESGKPWNTSWDFARSFSFSSANAKNKSSKKLAVNVKNPFRDEAPLANVNNSGTGKLDAYLGQILKRPLSEEKLFISHFRNSEEKRAYAEDLFFDAKIQK